MPARSSTFWDLDGADVAREPDSEVEIDVLIPTFERAAELAVTLSGLAAQLDADFNVIIADQSEQPVWDTPAVAAMLRVLTAQGRNVTRHRNLPRRGLAQQRQFLLDRSTARYVLYLDSDVWLEPGTISRMRAALLQYGGGFIGSAVQGLSFLSDRRPEQWRSFEVWDGPVQPEPMPVAASEAHERWKLHNAANLTHIAALEASLRTGALQDTDFVAYKVAWVGGCVLFDRDKLLECGGFTFWSGLPPEHAGEDVLAQWRVMERYGGAGLLPSGAVHLEAPTTVTNRDIEATDLL